MNIQANQLTISAVEDISSANDPLETRVSFLMLHSDIGGAWLKNDGSLTLGGPAVAEPRLSASSDLSIQTTGNLTVAASVTTTNPGQITLATLQDLLLKEPLISAGDISLIAHRDIVAEPRASVTAAGAIWVMADSDENQTGTIDFASDIQGGADGVVFHLAAADGLLTGSISGDTNFTKRGPGALRIASSNAYTGETHVAEGVLIVDGQIGAEHGAGAVVISADAVLQGSGDVNAPIFSSVRSSVIRTTGDLTLGDGSARGFEFAGTLLVEDFHTLTLRDADLAELGVLTRLGHGSTLIAANGVAVSDGERLEGNGSIAGNVFITFGGTGSPGISPGVLTTSSLNLLDGSIFSVEINGSAPGAQHDQFIVDGSVFLSNARLRIGGVPFRPSEGTVFVVINNDGQDPIQGQFVNDRGQPLLEGSEYRFNGITTVLSYVGGDGGNDVTLTVTDDPIVFVPPSSSGNSTGGFNLTFGLFSVVFTSGGAGDAARSNQNSLVFQFESTRSQSDNSIVEVRQDEIEDVEQIKLRVFFRRVDDVTGKDRPEEYELPVTDVRDVLDVFRQSNFDNGHYRVYAEVPGSSRSRLMLDLRVQGGKIVPKDFLQDGGANSPQSVGEERSKAAEDSPEGPATPPGSEESRRADQVEKEPTDGGLPSDRPMNAEDQQEAKPPAQPPNDSLGAVALGLVAARSLRPRRRAALEQATHCRLTKASRLLRKLRQDLT